MAMLLKSHTMGIVAVVAALLLVALAPIAQAAELGLGLENEHGEHSLGKAYTFVGENGQFPGLVPCADGVVRSHRQARDLGISLEDLPQYMEQYCEEDVSRALGVTLNSKGANEKALAEGRDETWNRAWERPKLRRRLLSQQKQFQSGRGGTLEPSEGIIVADAPPSAEEEMANNAKLVNGPHIHPAGALVVTGRNELVRVPASAFGSAGNGNRLTFLSM